MFALRVLPFLFMNIVSASRIRTKRLTTNDGTTYTYDYVAAQGTNATVLLLHGYPGTRHDWKHQITSLSMAGHGVLAPDSLGHGDSDLPQDVEAYNMKRQAGHFMEILDNEGIDTVVGVGHDWGTNSLSRSWAWAPERFDKLAFLSVGYSPPGVFVDFDALNAVGLETLGYMQFGYWYFFNSYNGANLAASNLDSFFSLAFPFDNAKWGDNLAALGAARSWLEANTTTPLPNYLTEEDRAIWLAAYGQKGSTEASMNHYKALLRGVQETDEEALTDEDRAISVPVLTIGGTRDLVTRADQLRGQTEPWARNGYTERTVDAGHWVSYEAADEVSSILLEFLAS